MRAFASDKKGSVAVIAAVVIGAMAIVVALLCDASTLYVVRLKSQRIADIANLAAAATSTPIVANAASPTAQATAANVAAINGFGSATVTTSAASSPSNDGNMALTTTVAQSVAPNFGAVLGYKGTVPVGAASIVEIGGSTLGPCLTSLLAPINIYNSASVQGSSCSIAAATYLYVCNSANVLAAKAQVLFLQWAEAPYICPGASMVPPASTFTDGALSLDALAVTPAVVAIEGHLSAMGIPGWLFGAASPIGLLKPLILQPGNDKTYTNTSATLPQSTRYRNVTVSSSALVFSGNGAADSLCITPTTMSGNLVLSGASTLTFNSGCYVIAGVVQTSGTTNFLTAAGAAVTIVFEQSVTNGSGALTFGPGLYSVDGNLNNISGGSVTFGDGQVAFGAALNNGSGPMQFGNGPVSFNGGIATNGSGSMTFGNGPFYVYGGGLTNSSTGTMTFGNGPFYVYDAAIANSSGTMTFGNGPFSMEGVSLTSGPGSNTTFGVGNMDFYGGAVSLGGNAVTFGAGGSASLGSGTISIYAGTLSLNPTTLNAVGESFALSGGVVNLTGAGTINATAPTSATPSSGYNNILFVIVGGAFTLSQSSAPTDTMSGLIYAPLSDIVVSGNQKVVLPSGGCLAVEAGAIDISQNATLAMAPCSGLGGTILGTVARLVQ